MNLAAIVRRIGISPYATTLLALLLGVAHAANITYTIEPATGRVTKATYPDGSYVTYSYDANGNRTAGVLTLAVDTTAPSAPGTPTFSAITATTTTASWAAASDNVGVTAYEISINGGSSWTNMGPSLSANLTGLTGSTTYTVLVHAKDAANNIGPNASASLTTSDVTPPSAPGPLSFSAITATTTTVTWTAATDNVGVTVYELSLNGGSSWTNMGTALSANLTSLTGSTTYTVLVRAKDAANNIGANRSGSFTTSDITPPSATGALAFSAITATSATATWTAATDNIGVTSYEWSINGGSSWTNVGNTLSASITGLTGSTNYTVLVRAMDAANNIGPNRSGSFTTAAPIDAIPPGAPGTPVVSAIAATTATATWTAASDNVGVTSYEWSINGGGTWNNVGNVLSVGLTGLTNATSYTFQVRAKDAANNTGPVSSILFTTLDNSVPTTPGTPGFSSITATSANASWTASTDNVGVTGYDYSLNGGAWTATSSASPSFGITGLSGSTSYTFAVRARDAAGNPSASSGTSSFTTSDVTPPTTPGTPGFSSITATSANASWTASTDNVGVTGYDYSLNGGAWTATGSASPSFNITGLSGSTSYTFAVRARDAAGNPSASSGTGSFTTSDVTPPTTPGTPAFSSITATSASASWTASTDNVGVTGYDYSLNGGAWTATGSASPSFGITGLSGSTSYTFAVRARDAAGNPSASSGTGSFTTTDVTPPSAPGTPTFSAVTSTSATASWGAASDNVGVASYEWSINGGSTWNSVGAALTASVSGLAAGTTYTFQVRARDAANNPGSASSASLSTFATITINTRTVATTCPSTCTAQYQLTNAGDIFASQVANSTTTDVGDWLSPKSGMSGYQARATGNCQGTNGSWLALSANVAWAAVAAGPSGSTASCSFTLDISHSSNSSVILGTATITLRATRQ